MHFDAGRETGEGEKGGANEAGPFEFTGYGREYVAGELRRKTQFSEPRFAEAAIYLVVPGPS